MIRVCLGVLAGTYALQLSSLPDVSRHIEALVVAALLLALCRRLRMVALGAALGALLFHWHASMVVGKRLDPDFAGDSLLTVVRIIDFPREHGESVTFVAEAPGDARVPPRIRVSWFEPPVTPRLGDVWQIELRLRRPRGTQNPHVFDYETWLFRERIGATGYIVTGRRNLLLDAAVMGPVDALRARFVERAFSAVEDRDAAAVIAAIAVGARHAVSDDQWDRFAATGTSHLMAISGLHVGLVATAAFLLCAPAAGLLRVPANGRDVGVLAAVGAAIAYAVVSGLGVPAQRAVLMLTIGATGVWLRREPGPARVVAAAALVATLADPLSTMAPGFVLSFAAVIGLLWFARAPRLRRKAPWPRRIVDVVLTLSRLQVRLLFALAPLTVLVFDRIALSAPLVNVIAVPLFSLVTVPFALLALACDGVLSPLGDRLLAVAGASISALDLFIETVSSEPAADIRTTAPEGIGWLSLLLCLATTCLPTGWPGRNIAWLALACIATARPLPTPAGCVDAVVLDVGQGLAVVLQTHRRALLYDTGPVFRDGGSMAERVVLPYLARRGIRHLQRVVVSHADLDHAGGLDQILEALAVGDVYTSEPLSGIGPVQRPCVRGDAWSADGIRLRVLHPPRRPPAEGNDASCVLSVEIGRRRLLLTGDIEAAGEATLVRERRTGRNDVVVVPHHGSATSSTSPFVALTAPDYAIVAAGLDNRWGLPKAEIVARWQNAGARVVSTSSAGAVSMRLCEAGGVVRFVSERERQRRIWHDRIG